MVAVVGAAQEDADDGRRAVVTWYPLSQSFTNHCRWSVLSGLTDASDADCPQKRNAHSVR